MRCAIRTTLRRRATARSAPRMLARAAVAAWLLATAGCGSVPLDQSRRHLWSAGLGGASMADGWSPQPDRLELHGAVAMHGAYDFRLTGPDAWLALSGRIVTDIVLGASVTGEPVAHPCDLFWAFGGPSLGLQLPATSALSFVGDAGVALAHVSRDGCSEARRTTATA